MFLENLFITLLTQHAIHGTGEHLPPMDRWISSMKTTRFGSVSPAVCLCLNFQHRWMVHSEGFFGERVSNQTVYIYIVVAVAVSLLC